MKQWKRVLALTLASVFCFGTASFAEQLLISPAPQTVETKPLVTDPNTLKVLAIGNSFSRDAMYWLYDIAKDGGVENIVLGNAFRSSCDLVRHITAAKENSALYDYDKNTTGKWVYNKKYTLENILRDEEWDVITLQQSSIYSGQKDSYEPHLTELIAYIQSIRPNAKLVWHTTWALKDKTGKESLIAAYNDDQMTMYNAILEAKKEMVDTHTEFVGSIPVIATVQNMRTSFMGDTVNRDGVHLKYVLGRYAASLTWYHALTGRPVDDISVVPDYPDETDPTICTPLHLAMIKECVKNAVAHPNEITQSAYTQPPVYNGIIEVIDEREVEGNIRVVYDGKDIDFESYSAVYPVLEDGKTLIPIRALAETLGASVAWDEAAQKVVIQKDDTAIEMVLKDTDATINGENYALEVAANTRDGRTMVPLRFVSEAFGLDVSWTTVKAPKE